MSTTSMMTVKTPWSWIQKVPRKKIYRETKANRRRRIRQRCLMTTMKLITKMVPTTTTAMGTGTVPVTAITEVTVIPAPKEAPQNGRSS